MDDTTVYVYLKPHLYDKIFIVYFTHVNFLITWLCYFVIWTDFLMQILHSWLNLQLDRTIWANYFLNVVTTSKRFATVRYSTEDANQKMAIATFFSTCNVSPTVFGAGDQSIFQIFKKFFIFVKKFSYIVPTNLCP